MGNVKQETRLHRKPTLKPKPEPKVSKGLLTAILLTLVAILAYAALNGHTYDAKQRIKLENTYQQLQKTQQELNQTKGKNLDGQKKLEDVNKQLEDTKKQLQSKKDSAKAYALEQAKPAPTPAPAPAVTPYVPSGNKDTWLAASGIPKELWWAVDYIVTRESGWNPCSYYPSQSNCNANPVNACGLVMQNPCHKIPGDWRDPVAALKWQYGYVNNRYGGYVGAVAYWQIHHNY